MDYCTCIYITDTYKVATTKYASSSCLSDVNTQNSKAKKNKMRITGNVMRIKKNNE